jgi:hypothetical protein
VKYLVEAFKQSQYETRGLNSVLQICFGKDEKMFGIPRQSIPKTKEKWPRLRK